MPRLSDEQGEADSEAFPEGNSEGRAGRKPVPTREAPEAVIVDSEYGGAMVNASAVLPEVGARCCALGFVQLASITMLLKRF